MKGYYGWQNDYFDPEPDSVVEDDPWQDELTEAEYYEQINYGPCGCNVCMCSVYTQYGVACPDCELGAHQG